MKQFFDMYKLSKVIQGKTHNLNIPISIKIELIINILAINKSPDPDSFTSECYQISKATKGYQFTKTFSRKPEQRKQFLNHAMRSALP